MPVGQRDQLLAQLLALPSLPKMDLPDELRFEEVSVVPKPCLKVKPPEPGTRFGPSRLLGWLSFQYDDVTVAAGQSGRGVYQPERRKFW